MFRVAVTDHIMIAHSFQGEAFGPAQELHGATYVVEAEFSDTELNEMGVVVDIADAERALGEVLAPLRFKNLDELDDFKGKNTTTEYMAFHIHQRLRGAMGFKGGLRVKLHESHVAWGSYED